MAVINVTYVDSEYVMEWLTFRDMPGVLMTGIWQNNN